MIADTLEKFMNRYNITLQLRQEIMKISGKIIKYRYNYENFNIIHNKYAYTHIYIYI